MSKGIVTGKGVNEVTVTLVRDLTSLEAEKANLELSIASVTTEVSNAETQLASDTAQAVIDAQALQDAIENNEELETTTELSAVSQRSFNKVLSSKSSVSFSKYKKIGFDKKLVLIQAELDRFISIIVPTADSGSNISIGQTIGLAEYTRINNPDSNYVALPSDSATRPNRHIYNAARDGITLPKLGQNTMGWFYNEMVVPAYQIHRPRYYEGYILSKDDILNTATIFLSSSDDFGSTPSRKYNSIHINVSFEYEDIDSLAFIPGTNVLIEFDGQTPLIIGFAAPQQGVKRADTISAHKLIISGYKIGDLSFDETEYFPISGIDSAYLTSDSVKVSGDSKTLNQEISRTYNTLIDKFTTENSSFKFPGVTLALDSVRDQTEFSHGYKESHNTILSSFFVPDPNFDVGISGWHSYRPTTSYIAVFQESIFDDFTFLSAWDGSTEYIDDGATLETTVINRSRDDFLVDVFATVKHTVVNLNKKPDAVSQQKEPLFFDKIKNSGDGAFFPADWFWDISQYSDTPTGNQYVGYERVVLGSEELFQIKGNMYSAFGIPDDYSSIPSINDNGIQNLIYHSEDLTHPVTPPGNPVILSDLVSPSNTPNTVYLTRSAHRPVIVPLSDSSQYTLSCYVRRNSFCFFDLIVSHGPQKRATFDLIEATEVHDAGIDGAIIVEENESWFRCSITFTTTTAAASISLLLLGHGKSIGASSINSVAQWGLQLTETSGPVTYVKTTGTPIP